MFQTDAIVQLENEPGRAEPSAAVSIRQKKPGQDLLGLSVRSACLRTCIVRERKLYWRDQTERQ